MGVCIWSIRSDVNSPYYGLWSICRPGWDTNTWQLYSFNTSATNQFPNNSHISLLIASWILLISISCENKGVSKWINISSASGWILQTGKVKVTLCQNTESLCEEADRTVLQEDSTSQTSVLFAVYYSLDAIFVWQCEERQIWLHERTINKFNKYLWCLAP